MRKTLCLCFLFMTMSVIPAWPAEVVEFRSAKPIWPAGMEREKNLFVGFRAAFDAPKGEKAVLRIAASSLYRAFVNGKFRGYGPARAAHGYFRVDEWDLTNLLAPGKNLVAIEVAGYNVNGNYLLDQPAFLQAEVVAGDEVLASTAGDGAGFQAVILPERVRKVQRYVIVRAFSEVYRPQPGYDRWRREISAPFAAVNCEVASSKKLLPRRVPYPTFAVRPPVRDVSEGAVKAGIQPEKFLRTGGLTEIGPYWSGFKENELEVIPYLELQTVAALPGTPINRPFSTHQRLRLTQDTYHILDFGTNLAGFLGVTVVCQRKTRLFLVFSEVMTPDGDVDFKRLEAVNIIAYELPEGRFELEAIEPYSLRYLKLLVLDGECDIESPYLREYVNPNVSRAEFSSSDERLNRVFEAGRVTFQQNAVDLFMDCPSRERTAWLEDSFWSARVAPDLGGDTVIERNFYENFLLAPRIPQIPEGMIPMCYPADDWNGSFIPHWALWFVTQLEEYLARSGDRGLVEALRPQVMGLFDYFKRFRNEDGLLEKLDGWLLLDFSESSRFVQDVNYPTNMLYAAALAAAGRIYDRLELTQEAERVRNVIRQQSFDGEFFVDNAVRKDGKLQVTRNRTEVCQYYAFFYDVATPQTHARLWQNLVEKFGTLHKQSGAFADILPTTFFIGNMQRLESLSRFGLVRQQLEEMVTDVLPMVEATGTVWEKPDADKTGGLCSAGFATHFVHALYRDALGLYRVDPVGKVVKLRFCDVPLQWCKGKIPLGAEQIILEWRRAGDKIVYQIRTPRGYQIQVENLSGKRLVRQR